MSDILERAFGPEPVHHESLRVDPTKIIPFHDCVYSERTGQCGICQEPRPAPPREEP